MSYTNSCYIPCEELLEEADATQEATYCNEDSVPHWNKCSLHGGEVQGWEELDEMFSDNPDDMPECRHSQEVAEERTERYTR